MDWKELTINDKEVIDEYTKGRFTTCDLNFSNQVLWSEGENTKFRIVDDVLILKGTYMDKDYYYMPIPKSESEVNLKSWKEVIKGILNEGGQIVFVPEYWKNLLEKDFVLEERRDSFDYVYNAFDLAYLKGRKYSKKKNRINNFRKSYIYEYEKLNDDNVKEVVDFQNHWYHDNGSLEVLTNEHLGILNLLKNYKYLGIKGGLIKVDGKIVAYTLGEQLTEDYAIIHIEKALNDYTGSYQMINQLFIQNEFENLKYINREDDFGDEGLREAKESYHPEFLLKKYEITGVR